MEARRVGGLEAEIAAAEQKMYTKLEAKGQLDAAATVILMNKAIEHAEAVGGLQAEIATAQTKLIQAIALETALSEKRAAEERAAALQTMLTEKNAVEAILGCHPVHLLNIRSDRL